MQICWKSGIRLVMTTFIYSWLMCRPNFALYTARFLTYVIFLCNQCNITCEVEVCQPSVIRDAFLPYY